jgi:beta-lactamase class A
MNLEKKFRELDKKLNGKYGIWVEWLDTGETWGLRQDQRFPTASVIKTQIMVALFERAKNDKRFSLDRKVRLRRKDIVEGSGVLRYLKPGVEMRLRDLCMLMIIVSDNTATNMVIDALGVEAINASIRSWGYENTVLNRKLTCDPAICSTVTLADTTPQETGDLLARIARRKMLGTRYDKEMEHILSCQRLDTALPRLLPWDKEGPVFSIAHKTGSITGARNDVGIVTSPAGRYVISVFTRKLKDTIYNCENEGTKGIAKVSKLTYDALQKRYGTR